jgi:hypothetical protein
MTEEDNQVANVVLVTEEARNELIHAKVNDCNQFSRVTSSADIKSLRTS